MESAIAKSLLDQQRQHNSGFTDEGLDEQRAQISGGSTEGEIQQPMDEYKCEEKQDR